MEKYAVIEIETGKIITVALWDGLTPWELGDAFRVEPFDPTVHKVVRERGNALL
jgi:hypothetical protein